MATAQTPRGINHVVLNVRDIEVSHRFWTEIMGFRCVAQLKPRPDRVRPKMRFYSGVCPRAATSPTTTWPWPRPRSARARRRATPRPEPDARGWGSAHVAIAWPDRESWLKQVEHLRGEGRHLPPADQPRHDSHSVYISDPDGHGIEVLYDLPCEVLEHDIDAAQNYAEVLPTEGPEAMVDRVDNPVFS